MSQPIKVDFGLFFGMAVNNLKFRLGGWVVIQQITFGLSKVCALVLGIAAERSIHYFGPSKVPQVTKI